MAKYLLSASQVKNLTVPPEKTKKTMHDGEGLYIIAEKNKSGKVRKKWLYRFNLDGKSYEYYVGTYPQITLAKARKIADEARELKAEGINPKTHKKALKATKKAKEKNSFEIVAREWFTVKRAKKAESTKKREIASLENDVFPYIGDMLIHEITPPIMLEVLKRIEGRAVETAHRVRSRCGMIFRYAISTGRCLTNPCRDLSDALTPSTKRHFPAITDMKRFAELLKAMDTYNGTIVVKSALKLAPLVAVRAGELRNMKWKDVNFKTKEWCFVASKTKVDHIVPLPDQAIKILKDLEPITRKDNKSFVFPNPRSPLKPMSDNGVLAALRILGFPKEEMTGHGFRATAKTELLELGFPIEWVEKMLAHAPKEAHGKAYNRAQYRPQRHEMMQAWANYLDELKASPTPDIDALKKKYTYRGRVE